MERAEKQDYQEGAQKEKGRAEGEEDENSGERRSGEQASVHDGIKEAVQRPAGQSFMRSWECSQTENEEEEEC